LTNETEDRRLAQKGDLIGNVFVEFPQQEIAPSEGKNETRPVEISSGQEWGASTKEILQILYQKMFHKLPSEEINHFIIEIQNDAGRAKVVDRLLSESSEAKALLASAYMNNLGKLLREDTTWNALVSGVSGANLDDIGLDVFIESGSTLLYVSYELYQALSNKERKGIIFGKQENSRDKEPRYEKKRFKRLSVRTNNNLTAWLFLSIPDKEGEKKSDLAPVCGPDEEPITPFLISGYLEGKYHGVFPFQEAQPPDQKDTNSKERLTREEQSGYSLCRIELSRRNLLLLATSRLSLHYGPTVGSRQNAMFKNATYNSCVPSLGDPPAHVLHLFITARKLIAHHPFNRWQLKRNGVDLPLKRVLTSASSANPLRITAITEWLNRPENSGDEGNAWTNRQKERFYSIVEEIENVTSNRCFPAFDVPLHPDEHKKDLTFIQSPFSSDLCTRQNTQPLMDGTSAISIGEGRFRVCSTWMEIFSKAHLSLDVFVSFKANYKKECQLKNESSKPPWIVRPLTTWIESTDQSLVFCENEMDCSCQECWIRREVQHANDRQGPQGVTFSFSVLDDLVTNNGPDTRSFRLGRICIRPTIHPERAR